ncbi:hypothetical protein BGW38_004672 [Lunasporangiospora selenospora]|uniref:Conserved oligomeric Golgi complex subunit 7 n=1 Tax=Lunasporangiospora selenospora TaxID=979761 RepID=A0A9P6KHA3_9FUNG|nr:hypothetical protein BGW38_004672 [Lunasporangiospora selenospora]
MSFQRDYGKLEAAHLHALVVKSVPAMAIYTDKVARDRELAKASSQLVKIMTTTNNLVFTLTEGAIGRCMRLTHGFGAQGLLDGLNGFFKEILDRYTEILMECRRRSGLQVESTHSTSETLSANQQRSLGDFGGGHSRTNSRNESKLDSSLNEDDNDQSEDSEGWDEDISEKEQRHFQMGLRLMVLCRQFCLKLEQLDLKTKRALRGVEELVKLDQTGGHSLSGNSAIQEASAGLADQLGVGVGGTGLRANAQLPGAVVALLQQSNLNSFRLSEILATVKASDPKDDPQHPHPTAKNAGLTGETMNLTEADRFATGGLDSKTHHLFLQSHQRAVQFTKLCQRFIFDSIYIPLVRPLKDLALQPCWTEGLDAQSGQDQGVDDGSAARRVYKSTLGGTRTDVIKFRSGPSEYMEELLKHLRSLPSTFGVYEGDIGLRFGIQALPYADRPADAHHQQGDESVSSLNMDGTRATTGVSGGSGAQGEAQGLGIGEAMSVEKIEMEDQPALNEEEDSDSAVMHRWITSLSRAAMHALIEQLYDPAFGTTSSGPSPSRSTPTTTAAQKSQRQYYLTRLSESGAKQLETDLGYFVSTYLGSLAIEPTPSFQSLLRALSLGEAGLLRALQQLQQLRQQHQQQQNEEGAEGDEGDEEREDKGKRAKTSGGESVAVDREQASILVPGGPVLPTVLTAGHEDELEQLEQEQKIFEWVARLKGIAILSL